MYRVLKYIKTQRDETTYRYEVMGKFDSLDEARKFCEDMPMYVIQYSKKAIKEMAA